MGSTRLKFGKQQKCDSIRSMATTTARLQPNLEKPESSQLKIQEVRKGHFLTILLRDACTRKGQEASL